MNKQQLRDYIDSKSTLKEDEGHKYNKRFQNMAQNLMKIISFNVIGLNILRDIK